MAIDPLGEAEARRRATEPPRPKTGFASQADDQKEPPLDLHDLLAPHPHTTYYFRVAGPLIEQVPILHGDILIIDRALPIVDGVLVVAVDDGDFVVRRVRLRDDQCVLVADNQTVAEMVVTDPATIFGCLTHVIHAVPRPLPPSTQ